MFWEKDFKEMAHLILSADKWKFARRINRLEMLAKVYIGILSLKVVEEEFHLKVKSLSCVQLFVTPWTVANQASLSMGFSRQEYWSGLPFPSPGDLPNPGIKPRSPALQADTLPSEPPGKS